MKVLGIDTSTKSLGIAIVEDGRLIIGCERIFDIRHSQDLIPVIKKSLKDASLKIEDIDGFSVSLGPGSFTGLRVGITAAKTLAIVTKKPIIGVPTLDVIAHNAYYYPGLICPILDARKQKLYAALYQRKGKTLSRLSKYLLLSIDELLKKVDKRTLFIGDGIESYNSLINKAMKQKAEFAPTHLWLPKPEHVANLGWQRLKRGAQSKPLDIVPLYLHSKECNIRR